MRRRNRHQPKAGEVRRNPAKPGGPILPHQWAKSAKKWTKMHAPERPQSTSRIVNAVRNRSWPTGTLRLQRPDPDQKKHGETRRNTVKHGGRNRVGRPKRQLASSNPSQAPWESAPSGNRGRPGKTGENRETNSTPPMGEKCRKMDENACTGGAPKHLKDRKLSAKAQLAPRKHQATAAGSGPGKTR